MAWMVTMISSGSSHTLPRYGTDYITSLVPLCLSGDSFLFSLTG